MLEKKIHPYSNVFENINQNSPEVVSMSTDQIRQTEEYEERVKSVIQDLGISPDEFARYPGAYMITEQLKSFTNNNTEAGVLNESLSKEQIISKDDKGHPVELNINNQTVFLKWKGDKIESLSYKGFNGEDASVIIPRDIDGKVMFGDLGEPLSGRDIPYQVLAESIAKKIQKQESGNSDMKKIIISEFFLRNRTELSGFFNRFAREKEKLGTESTRRTVIVAIKAFEGDDKSSQMNLRMDYRQKYGSPSEVKDAKSAEQLNSQYKLTSDDMLALKESKSIDDVISVDNTSTLEFKADSDLMDLEKHIKANLLANSEIVNLIEECKHGDIDVFVTGPVASGKSTVAKVLAKMLMGKE